MTILPSKTNPVLERPADRHYSGEPGDYLDVGHSGALALSRGTISLSFSLESLYGDMALISKDLSGQGAGQFTVWIKDGTLLIAQESASGTEYLKVPEVVLSADTAYHFALTFGKDGLEVWLNGQLVASEPEFKQGIAGNDAPLVVGATRAWRGDMTDDAHSLFKGTIGDVQIYGRQLDDADMTALAAEVNPMLGMAAGMAHDMADLMPTFGQMHHASDTLREIAEDYGLSEHGHVMRPLDMKRAGRGDNEMEGGAGADGLDGNLGDDLIDGKDGDDILQGGYGNDTLLGSRGNDILDGGHGEDRLVGGAGNDLLISRSDAREPKIARDPGRDEGDPYGELTKGKLYPKQPINGDDEMTGGRGADIFYFQTLINAKKRYIEKHTNDDGTIRWHGVAGENDKLHDHWVDHIGNDVVTDYNRAEGDRLVIEGHTTKIKSISYSDSNGDGVMDRSLIKIYSDQGAGGGAHNQDKLGQITVYGDLVKRSDIETTSAPAYGIVATSADIREAIRPLDMADERGPIRKPAGLEMATETVPSGKKAVLALSGTYHLTGEPGDYLDVGHSGALALSRGTISLSFSLESLYGDMALISKDLSGQGAGQFTVWIKDGTLLIAQESASGTEYLKVPEVVLSADTAYHFALTFGKDGLEVWLNGQLVASEPEFKQGIAGNDAPLVVGATRAWRGDMTDDAHSLFKGTIGDVQIYGRQLDDADMTALAAEVNPMLGMAAGMAHDMADLMPTFGQMHHASDTLREIAEDYGLSEHGHVMRPLDMKRAGRGDNEMEGGAGADGLDGNLGDDLIDGKDGDDILQGGYGNDTLLGSRGNDILDGGHGEDRLVGGAGNDLLISRSDAREPKIARDPGRDEGDPYGELTKGKLYPKQPINGDDEMTGGRGADIFYFQTLINAKKRYIEKHTNDDGTIRWHGVAGENDKLHDHWVDHIGNDVVTDYNRAEGDRLVIEGHTTKIKSISYSDSNGDGVMDRSLIKIYSDQGAGGGAHNQDKLGQITVYGDLVKRSDIETTSAPAYGIVATSADIREAIRPLDMADERGPIRKPAGLPGPEDMALAVGGATVLAIPTAQNFAGQSQNALVFEHEDALALRNGTIALRFSTASELTWGALFSKDASDNGKGGHLTAFIEDDGDLVVRLQTATESHWIVASNVIRANSTYDFAFSFGKDGAALYLDGVKVAYDEDLTQHLLKNGEALIVGANGWSSTPGKADMINGAFNGTIEEFAIYKKALTAETLYGAEKADGVLSFDGSASLYRFALDEQGKLMLTRGEDSRSVPNDARFLEFDDLTVRPEHVQLGSSKDDTLHGTNASDILIGGRGADSLLGGDHDDLLEGGADGDWLYAGDGRDTVFGGQGDDYIDGGLHRDVLKGGLGDDEIKGGGANDRLYGGLGDDILFGNSWGTAGGPAERDKAVFDGDFADYDIFAETYFNSTRGKEFQRLVVEDSFDGGADGVYEGRDVLYDVDALVFADLTISVSDLL